MSSSIRSLIILCYLTLAWPPLGLSQQAIGEEGPGRPLLAPVAVERYYSDLGAGLVWADEGNFADLMLELVGLENHGLDPGHYHLELLRQYADQPGQRDRLATDAWFSAAAHMLYGKLDPVSIEPNWTAARRQSDLSSMLRGALESNAITGSIERFAPTQREYGLLLGEYNSLRNEAEIALPVVAPGPALRSGMSGARVEALQSRLNLFGYLEDSSLSQRMDDATIEALRYFQLAMDLDDDGIAGTATLNALNRGFEAKLNQLRVNLERWRWLPDDLGDRHVRANIATFSIAVWEGGVLQRSHLAIVGKTYRKTPVFSDQIEYIIFNPWWEVPASIARIDKLPLFQSDPAQVTDLGFQILDRNNTVLNPADVDWHAVRPGSFPYRLRQAPGAQNALGEVKIMFPNSHNVYMHDTPTRGLFSRRQRAFSSGCLRTQDPLDLSEWLLSSTPGWDRARIDAAVASGRETRATLTRPIPVHILYFTAVADERGGIRYVDDIYQRDQRVLEGLRAAPY